MFKRKKLAYATIFAALAITLASGALPAQVAPATAPAPADRLPNVAPDMENERFWVGKLANSKQLIMSRGEIEAFNKEITLQSLSIAFDLTAYPQTLAKETLTALLLAARFPAAPMYSGGAPVDGTFYETLRERLNLAGVQENNAVRYGFAVTRASIRTFPTARGVFDSPDDREFDAFQETVVDPAEPLLILHQSRDGRWYYVQTRNYRGWLVAGEAAIASTREAWLAYATGADFLVVTGSTLRVETGDGGKPLVFEMGARIPLAGSDNPREYRIELPTRDSDGQAVFRQAVLPAGSDVSVGYLPFTRENILRQALKMRNTRYGWGGLFDGVDCSAFVMDVYRSFGILLPRNADQQLATAGKGQNLRGLPLAAKRKAIRSLKPGAALFTVSHVVLYLGEDKGRQYVIHALPAYRETGSGAADGDAAVAAVMRVVVSDVELVCTDGKTLLDSLIGSKQFEGE